MAAEKVSASRQARTRKAPADRKPVARSGPEPIDVEAAAAAARSEAADETYPFVLRGEEFVLPPATDWPIEVTAKLAEGNLFAAIEFLLDDDDEFQRLRATRPTMGEVNALFDQLAVKAGMGNLPNS